MKIVTIGGATYDILIKYEQAQMLQQTTAAGKQSLLVLEEGKKLEVDSVEYKTGGGATNSATSFARLGFDVEAFFKIGTDFQGQLILEALKKEGVVTHNVVKSNEDLSSVSCIISGKSADRTVLVYRGIARTLRQEELPFASLESAGCVYVASLSGKAVQLLPIITAAAKKNNALVAANPSSGQLKLGAQALHEALSSIDILILNHYEASMLMHSLVTYKKIQLPESNTSAINNANLELLHKPLVYEQTSVSLHHYVNVIHTLGPRYVVVTNGKEGVYVAADNKILFHPSLPTRVVSSLGAGDAFGAGFTAGLCMGKSVDDAIRMGVLNSAGVIGYNDAKTGLLKKTEMEQQLAMLDKKLLHKFDN